MNTRAKLKLLKSLALKRRRTRWKDQKGKLYFGFGDSRYGGGQYECDFVSPYTKTAGNVDSTIMVMLQDWSSDQALRRTSFNADIKTYGYYPPLPTNRNLERLLREHFDLGLCDIYGTNLFPFIKQGEISERVNPGDLVKAAKEFGWPQIKIVQPKLVICLGKETFNALAIAAYIEPAHSLALAIKKPFQYGKTWIWCQAHTGSWGQNGRKREQVAKDWRRMKMFCEKL